MSKLHVILARLRHLDCLPRLLCLTVLAGLSEGLGITLFVPLIQLIENNGVTAGSGRLASLLSSAFAVIGLPVTVATTLMVAGALILGGFALGYWQKVAIFDGRNNFLARCRRDLMEALLDSDWDHLSAHAGGKVINQLINESLRASMGLQMLAMFVGNFILLIIYTVFTMALSWSLLFVAVLFTTFTVALTRPLTLRSAFLGKMKNEADSTYSFVAVDMLRAARFIKVSGLEKAAANHLENYNKKMDAASQRSDRHAALHTFSLQAVPVVVLCLVISVAHYGFSTPSSHLFVFLLLLGRIAPRVTELQQRYEAYLKVIADFDTLDRTIRNARLHREDPGQGGGRLERPAALRLENLTYRYPNQDVFAVNGVSLSVAPRQMVAFVGGSGSGKSTLLDLIANVRRPTAGRVLVNERDMAEYSTTEWRHAIGYVTQEVVLFNSSLRDNLVFGRSNVSDEQIWKVLEAVQLADTVRELPRGLKTELGESGLRLSGGQKQRLSLARALIHQPELLILDEATSALDNETERAVQQAIEELRSQFTIIIIAHRLSTVRAADCIHVLEGGKIVESGAFEDLLSSGGRFSSLYKAQFNF